MGRRGRGANGENEERVKREGEEEEEEEGESKTNKRIKAEKIVLKDLKLSFCQYAFAPAKRGLVAVSFRCPANSSSAKLHKVGVCCPLYDERRVKGVVGHFRK